MLDELVVSNLGLIETASIELRQGLTVLTGETGAGKTLMLGALRLLSGANASRSAIGPHGDTLDVSARFITPDGEVIVRRSLDAARSRAYADGAIVTAGTLGDLIGDHIDIVAQHDRHSITSQRGVRALLDRLLDEDGTAARAAYRERWNDLDALEREAASTGGDVRALAREAEMLAFQAGEIDEAGFGVDDEAELRATAGRLRNAEALASEVASGLAHLGEEGAIPSLTAAVASLDRARRLDPELETVAAQASDVVAVLSDLIGELVGYASDLEPDQVGLADIEDRLALLESLKRKYGSTVEEILLFRKEAGERGDHLAGLLSAAASIDGRLASARAACIAAGDQLIEARRRAAAVLEAAATTHLTDLGFAHPALAVQVDRVDPTSVGTDRVTLEFASDAALGAAPVASIASGGELSRLVLALTLAAGGANAQIVAFDEIDAGIGGATALAMGRKLATLARDRQVLCVTHLPQVAAFGDQHLVIERVGNTTTVTPVSGNARIAEITRMLAGLDDSQTGQQHATELLEIADRSVP
ncbi:MAG: AAA family ATPase [Acidimicrobiia bacterium]